VRLTLDGEQSGWREIMRRYDTPLRDAIVDASLGPEPSSADVDDLMGDFWLSLIEEDVARLRRFNPARGAALLSWLTIQLVQALRAYEQQRASEPEMVPLDEAKHVAVARQPRRTRHANHRAQEALGGHPMTIDGAIRECVRSTVVAVVREELAAANRERNREESDRPRAAAWWAEQLGCSAESLVKRAKRGSLEYVRIGARYYFTRAQIDGSRRWQRSARGADHVA
jgi:hypothetical protein